MLKEEVRVAGWSWIGVKHGFRVCDEAMTNTRGLSLVEGPRVFAH